MPTPIGHALAGVAVGCLIAGRHLRPRDDQRPRLCEDQPTHLHRWPSWLLRFGLLGILPDADFLVGLHSTYTHSIGATLVAGLATAAWVPRHRAIFGFTAAAAYGTHVLLDWLGRDPVFPFGIMALWPPVSSDFYLSGQRWFLSVCREYWLGSCWWQNARAIVWEVAVLGPLALGAAIRLRRTPPDEDSGHTPV